MRHAFLSLFLIGCAEQAAPTGPDTAEPADTPPPEDTSPPEDTAEPADTGSDCEPAEEICDGQDNDCDGEIDEDAADASSWYTDGDGDGYGDPDTLTVACEPPDGAILQSGDCDDADAAISPDGEEICDEADNDCDGDIDEDASDQLTWYADIDGDGYGDADSTTAACSQPSGFVSDSADCNDSNEAINPGVEEVCDEPTDYNCDGSIGYADADGDGWAACTDCNDTDPEVNPDGTELCDEVDNDCDGNIDEDDASDASNFYIDSDGDGFGDAAVVTAACSQPSGYVSDSTDCDDTDADISPDGEEVCDEADNDCDGEIDEDDASDQPTWYADADSDGYGSPDASLAACEQPSGYVSDSADCDDTDGSINPDGEEVCDGDDNDCSGTVDGSDASDAVLYYIDSDGDGYGDADTTTLDCDVPSGYADNDEDCNDGDGAQFPGADELCNGEDDDCDATVDEDAIDILQWYADSDTDGYGDPDTTDRACEAPSGYVADDSDCDDTDPDINPSAEEVCDGADNDCDRQADEGSAVDALTWYRDSDTDGYGDPDATDRACSQPSGFVSDDTDCDDGDGAQYPGADEYCNAEDDDCNGTVDEDAADASSWYADTDGDGYGDASTIELDCDILSGYVDNDEDCNDGDGAQYPGADEYCNEEDDDCDGIIDEDAAVDVAVWYADGDGDGFGDSDDTTLSCDQPVGFVADDTDCDADDGSTYPGAAEVCGDGSINDCDGSRADAFETCGLYGDVDLADAEAILIGEDSTDYAGWSVSSAGDVDGDGLDDILVGAYNDEEGGSSAGAAYLVLGGVSGEEDLANAHAAFIGEDTDDYAGTSVAGGGDINGDGYDDLLIGAYGDDDGNSQAGAVYVVFGAVSGELDLSQADIKLIGEDAGDFSGQAVASAGDVNGDGLDDILVGAYGDEDGASSAGSAYLIFGGISSDTSLSSADVQLIGESRDDYAGWSVSGAGDVDGDGLDDVLVGAYGDDDNGSEAGAVYVVLGGVSDDLDLSAADQKLIGADGSDNAGWSVSSAGDFNGDGLDDILVGAARDDVGGSYSGTAYVVLGGVTGDVDLANAYVELIGESVADYAGWSVSGIGDVNGDALSDVLVGAYGDDESASNAGAAYLILGGMSGSLDLSQSDIKLLGTSASDNAGRAVAGAGDVDGDGFADLLVGANGVDDGGSSAGAVYLLLGGGY